MKRKIITLSLIVAMAATAVIGGTLAYFTDEDVENNEFTVGNVDIDLTEPGWRKPGKSMRKPFIRASLWQKTLRLQISARIPVSFASA